MIKAHIEPASKVAVLTLNNPTSLNALNFTMIDTLYRYLINWRHNDNVACVVIDSAGDKAFCAGGDVQALYHAMQQAPKKACPAAEDFFSREYRLDYLIHTYSKPIIVWGSGIVMGGGLGLFAGADFRVVTETSRMAMPEITIGLYPDVGGSYFLNTMPGHCGRFLALTGAVINAQDSLFVGLANAFVCNAQYPQFMQALYAQKWVGEKNHDSQLIEVVLADLAESSAANIPTGNIEANLTTINTHFSEPDTANLIDAFLNLQTDVLWLHKAQRNVQQGSPLSALLIDKQLRISRKHDLKSVFQSELVLSTNIVRFSEFSEGVRALLIDKDGKPNWHYKNYRDVPNDVVASFFKAPWSSNPLHDL